MLFLSEQRGMWNFPSMLKGKFYTVVQPEMVIDFIYLSYFMWSPQSINTLGPWTDINSWLHLLYALCKVLFQSCCMRFICFRTLWSNKSSLLRLKTLFKETEGKNIIQESLPWINSEKWKFTLFLHSPWKNDIWMISRMLWFFSFCYSNHIIASFCTCPGKTVLLAPNQSAKVTNKILILLVLYVLGNWERGSFKG